MIDRITEAVLAIPRPAKRLVALALDAGLCLLTVWLAFYLRLGVFVPLAGVGWPAAIASLLIALPLFVRFGLYRAIFRYVSWDAFVAIANAILIFGILYFSIFTVFGVDGVPRTVGIIHPVLLLVAVGASRMFGRYWLSGQYRERLGRAGRKNVLIYGAGSAGRQLAIAIAHSPDMSAVGFIDDSRSVQGSSLNGKPVLPPEAMEDAVRKFQVAEILLAIPSAGQRRRNEIIKQVRALGVAVRTLPGFLDVARGTVTVTHLRPLDIDDLLGRDPVDPDPELLARAIKEKVVLVTGGGGSIGSELSRQIIKEGPTALLLVEASEFALYRIHNELEQLIQSGVVPPTRIVPLLATVCDEERMRRIFEIWKPDTVYHAAAFKHVPLVEHNVVEGVRNNVLGTWTCARIALEHQVADFVLISTDKAVRPTNVMGASKRLAELGLQALAQGDHATCFSMVRFGNVLGSSGSVVPLFWQQISAGGPLTVTHPEITRYFMTIPEAAQLVLQAGAMGRGGDVFVLDMGMPVKVFDLAQRMISLSGLKLRNDAEPNGDIEVAFTGLRPGEKLYEELLIGNDPKTTPHPRIMVATEDSISQEAYIVAVNRLVEAIDLQQASQVKALLFELIPEYQPEGSMVDYLEPVSDKHTRHRPLRATAST